MTKNQYKKIFSESDWNVETLDIIFELLDKKAKEWLKLDCYANQFEIVSADQLLNVYSSIGLPVNYPHWKFGKDYMINQNKYLKGRMGLSYEMIINSNPCISYNIEENDLCLMTLVYAHAACGHNHFFKNNYMFKDWTHADSIIDYMKFAHNFILQCEKKYGPDTVEDFLDCCHSIQNYGIDSYHHPKFSLKKEQDRIQETLKWEEEHYDSVLDRNKKQKEYSDYDELDLDLLQKTLKEPQENILYFLEKFTPKLSRWKRELIRIVRKVGQYFSPQGQCLIGNTYIATENGLQRIENLIENEGYYEKKIDVLSFGNQFEKTSRFYKKKVNKTIKVSTVFGFEIEGTTEHPIMILTPDLEFKMKKLSELTKEDVLVLKKYPNIFASEPAKIDFNFKEKEKNEFIECIICEHKAGNLIEHLKTHNISCSKYTEIFEQKVFSEKALYARSKPFNIPEYMTPGLARLFGYLVSEGNSNNNAYGFSNTDYDMIQDAAETLDNLRIKYTIVKNKNTKKGNKQGWRIYWSGEKIREFFEYCGFYHHRSYFKVVPSIILRSDKEIIKGFLSALYEGDGCNTKNNIGYSTRSKELAQQIQQLLLGFGIVASIKQEVLNNYEYKVSVPHKIVYCVVIYPIFYDKFLENIGFLSKRKNKRKIISSEKKVTSLNAYIPYVKKHIVKLRNNMVNHPHKNTIVKKKDLPEIRSKELSIHQLEKYKELLLNVSKIDVSLSNKIQNVIDEENFYLKINNIENICEEKYVYDFTIPSNHLFYSNGFISHNTKVENEGCATFVHYYMINRLFDEGYLPDSFMLEFYKHHTNVIYQPTFDKKYFSGINPYTLGFSIFSDIKRICETPTEEDKYYFPNLIDKNWLDEFHYAVANFRDDSFIQQYLSPNVIRNMKLFSYVDDEEDEKYYTISNIHDEKGYRKIRELLSLQYNRNTYVPNISVASYDELEQVLMLEYKVKNGITLNADERDQTLDCIEYIWGSPVDIKYIEEDEEND